MFKIALITGSERPIPATLGGATQTMITHLIDENESNSMMELTVFSYYEDEAFKQSTNYKHTNFIYYQANQFLDNISLLPYRFLRKLTCGRSYLKSNFIRFCIRNMPEDIDGVIVEGNYFQVLQLKKELNKDLILHMHIDGLHVNTDNGLNILNACKGVFVISDYCRKRVLELDSSRHKDIRIVKNCIDTELFDVSCYSEFRHDFRKINNIKENDKVIVFCGRLVPDKGIKELVTAFKELNNNNIRLLIIGSSVYKNANETPFLKDLVNSCKELGDRVIFTGFVPQLELPKYYSVADISVVPSLCQEAAGNVIIESLSCSLPVITTNRGGIPEYADESSCIIVHCDKLIIDNLKNAILSLLDSVHLYNNKRSCARSIALQYDKKGYYDRFYSNIKYILNK